MVLAEGRIIVLTEQGELILVEANPKEYREFARVRYFKAGRAEHRSLFPTASSTPAIRKNSSHSICEKQKNNAVKTVPCSRLCVSM